LVIAAISFRVSSSGTTRISAPDLTQIYSRLAQNLSAEKKNQEISAIFAAVAALLFLCGATMSAVSARI
jgi:hypothetical protein